jgi:quercetin dioxygenase-like cupin family protein
MKRLIDAFEGLLTAATVSGGDLAKTANFTLENVNWKETLGKPEPIGHPIVGSYLEAACAHSGPDGSSSNEVAKALLAVSNQLHWRTSSKSSNDGPDIAILLRNFAVTTVIGVGGLLPTDNVYAGFSLQAPDTYYPPHAHHAEESYWITGGNGDWRVGPKPWFAVEPGDSIYHQSGVRHAMQTNEQPLLTVWLWTSHLDSAVVIVRD